MKKILFILFLLPFIGFSQVQIGEDIDGEFTGDNLGSNISLSSDGSIVAIGAPFNDANGSNSGHVRVYENLGGVWTQIGSDINGEAIEDLSGYNISLSADGSIVAIGAIENDENGVDSGHVRIYENLGGIWTQVGSDINGEAAGDISGNSVSLSSDGAIVAIGGRENDENGSNSGHVRVYENLGGVWTQIGSDINGEVAADVSGWSISLSSDGSILAIGSPFNDANGDLSGHVRVYENLGGVWMQIGSNINGENSGDLFGFSVSLSSDGSILAIGAPVNDENGLDSGHVRIYENMSGVWMQKGFDIGGESAGDNFGNSVSLSLDGNSVAIGAVFNTGVNGSNSGHVRVYDVNGILSTNDFNATLFTMYPNPAKDQLNIQLENILELQNVSIYNNLGKLVLTSKEIIIDVSKLSTGLYLVDIETTKGKSTKKLIIE